MFDVTVSGVSKVALFLDFQQVTLWYCAEGQPSWSLSSVQRLLSFIGFEAAGSLSYPRMSALSPLLWQLHYMHSLIEYSHRLGVPCAAAAPHPVALWLCVPHGLSTLFWKLLAHCALMRASTWMLASIPALSHLSLYITSV